MTRLFRDDGFESSALIANTLLSGVVLSGQGTQNICLLGACAHLNTTLKENDNNGRVIAYISAGNADFPCTLIVSGNKSIFHTTNDALSLFYYTQPSGG
jgi:hypothetical protein